MIARYSIAMLTVVLAATSIGCQLSSAHCGLPISHNLPPAERILEPGPGVGGPGPGVLPPTFGPSATPYPSPSAQVLFAKPDAMQVRWDIGGGGMFDSSPLIVPGRQNFPQGGIYRLKLTNVEGREGVELYPSLEIGPTTPRTAAFLAHNAIPVQFTEEDFDQVMTGNFVTKVIYLPDPEFQELALAGVDTLVSTRLDPGIDPIVEADRRGAILAIVRLGNKDEEMPGADMYSYGAAPVAYHEGAPGGAVYDGAGYGGAAYGGAPYGGTPYAGGPMPGGGGPSPGSPLPFSAGTVAPNYISGVTAAPWGMPITGTPIGLPGPPHVPLGVPAGLQKHVIHNHTHRYIPDPVKQMKFHVQQAPGLSYPAPPTEVYVKEQTIVPKHANNQPPGNMVHIRKNLAEQHGFIHH